MNITCVLYLTAELDNMLIYVLNLKLFGKLTGELLLQCSSICLQFGCSNISAIVSLTGIRYAEGF